MLASPLAGQTAEDPYRWLDEVEGEKALAWVAAHNEQTLAALQAYPAFEAIYSKNLEIYSSAEDLSVPQIRGDYVYDLWQDEEHERGLWRRTLLDSWVSGDASWETLLDLDSLDVAEGTEVRNPGRVCLPPEYTRCMVSLSRGGRDAAEVRELDVERKAFVEGGFVLPEARSSYAWKDANTLYVATDFGEGTTTEFGWPRIVKEWRRGTSLDEAAVLFVADSSDVLVFPYIEHARGRSYVIVVQERLAQMEYELFALANDRLIRLDIPPDAWSRIHPGMGQLILLLKSDWPVGETTYPQGALLSIDFDGFLEGSRDFEVIFTPDERSHVWEFEPTKSLLLVNMLRDAHLGLYWYRREAGRWVPQRVRSPQYANTYYVSFDRASDNFFFGSSGFLTSPTVSLAREDGTVVQVKSEPPAFDVDSFTVNQYEATSRDGTQIPYFIVHHHELQPDGLNPTLLYGYGGYGQSVIPDYDPDIGTAWLERGGVYVLANIRGGGEFGPSWHRAALREGRQRAFDDFIAVAENLIARGITSPRHLGIMGHSNGGLLVGAVVTQRPDLFGAVACLNPVLDLSQADQLPDAGAEFGNPNDPEDWAYMERLSPYHNVSREESYPEVLFMTSRTDDRVSPGHARKMAAKMEEMGHAVYFYEPEEGGHGGAVSLEQRALRDALIYSYLLAQLR
jgi:prolyl oligopeptidase